MQTGRNSMCMDGQRDSALLMCRDYFRNMDLNDDGRLCSNEYLKMIEYVGVNLDTTQLKRAYEKADKNKDGTISYNEFIDAYTSEMELNNPGKSTRRPEKCIETQIQNDKSKDKILRKCREYFKDRDKNKDGQLDPGEFQKMMEYVGVDIDVSEMEKAYLKADHDGNGSISFKEFLDAFCNNNTQTQSKANQQKTINTLKRSSSHSGKELRDGCQYFWTNDMDRDGKLSMSEFTAMIVSLGMNLTKREINKAFRVADVNSDGYVSFGEFVRLYLNKVLSKSITTDDIKDIFHNNDQDQKGYLHKQECFHLLRLLGCNSDNESLEKLVTIMNEKEDGKITLQDYCIFLGLHK